MTRPARLARRFLIALAAVSGTLASCQFVSALGPDFELWLDAGRPDPTVWEQIAERGRRLGIPDESHVDLGHRYSTGDRLRICTDVEIQDGEIDVAATRIFVEEPLDFEAGFVSNDFRFPARLSAILFGIAISVLLVQRLARAYGKASSRVHSGRPHSEGSRPPIVLGRFCALLGWTVAVGILLAASICLVSMTGLGSTGTISITSERSSNKLHEKPAGVTRAGTPIDLRLDWRFAGGGMEVRPVIVRASMTMHVSSFGRPEPTLAFLGVPRLAAHRAHLGSGFVADGLALQLGGWLPVSAATLIVLRFLLARRRRRLIALRGLCRNCEYDLTGNASGICPECGQPAEAAR